MNNIPQFLGLEAHGHVFPRENSSRPTTAQLQHKIPR